MTEQIYRVDAYARETAAKVLAVTERGGIVLDRTIFYASAGGQPGDRGVLRFDGDECPIATTVYDTTDKSQIVHVAAEGAPLPPVGASVTAALDWESRYKMMRMHTGMHLLCGLLRFPVTGGQISVDESRLDFDIQEATVDKDELTAALNAVIAEDHAVSEQWITDAELDANPGLVRTLSVAPPRGTGRVRLVLIGDDGAVDKQPCGGTHVKRTGEIGRLVVTKIEKKGKINRRFRVAFG